MRQMEGYGTCRVHISTHREHTLGQDDLFAQAGNFFIRFYCFHVANMLMYPLTAHFLIPWRLHSSILIFWHTQNYVNSFSALSLRVCVASFERDLYFSLLCGITVTSASVLCRASGQVRPKPRHLHRWGHTHHLPISDLCKGKQVLEISVAN